VVTAERSSTGVAPTAARTGGSLFADALAIIRYHIVLCSMGGMLVFGWLETGRYLWGLALVVAADWFVINLLNRVTDVGEDLKNGIQGTERVARAKAPLAIVCFALLGASFVVTHLLWPALTPWRVAVQAIGIPYSYRLIPTPRGLRRMKDLYFLKNFGSACIFVLTGFGYPLAVAARTLPWPSIALLVLFFLPFEITFEILYDLRDLEGDRAEGVPTFPVVHGPLVARRIVDALLVLCTVPLFAGLALGHLGLREGLLLAAPPLQLAFYRPRLRRGLTSRDCIWLTHLATGLMMFWLAGNAVWLAAGLPANVFLVTPSS
jgi:4-hydroxybenzoate polyprenyltransferase